MSDVRAYRVRYTLLDFALAEDGPMLTTSQVAQVMGISTAITRDLVDAGDIRGVFIGRDRRIVWRGFRAYLFSTGVLPLTPAEIARRADAGQLSAAEQELRERVVRLESRIRYLERVVELLGGPFDGTPTINPIRYQTDPGDPSRGV